MKSLVYAGVSALVVALGTAGVATTGLAAPTAALSETKAPIARESMTGQSLLLAQRIMRGDSGMTFSFSAPFITHSGVRGSSHFIRVAVVGMSLKDLMISIPSQMERYEGIRVVDQNGREIPAKISATKQQAAIVFNQPVAPDTHLEVLFTGVRMGTSDGDTLFYGVTAERTGLRGEIPIGTARIEVPNRG
jgi:hypothetical protein